VSGGELPSSPILPERPLGALLPALRPGEHKQPAVGALQQAAKDFESVLLHKVLEGMKRTIPDSGFLGSAASKQVEDLFWFYLAQHVSEKGGLGLWEELYRQLNGSDGTKAAHSPEQYR